MERLTLPTASSTTLILVRHAHNRDNSGGDQARMNGGLSNPGLDQTGIEQLVLLAQQMDAWADVTDIYCSPQQRAMQTALAIPISADHPPVVRPCLREIDCGEADGVRVSEVRRRFPREWEANQRQEDPEFRWPGGESYRAFRQRCLEEITAIAGAHAGEKVVVVTHAGVIAQVVGSIFALSPARWSRFRPGNASITEVRCDGGKLTLVRFDDRSHLATASAGNAT